MFQAMTVQEVQTPDVYKVISTQTVGVNPKIGVT